MIRSILVVDEKQNRSLISVLPNMSIFVDFFPRKSSVASEERIGVGVGGERFSNVTDGEHETGGGGRGVGRSWILSFGVAVNLESASLRYNTSAQLGDERRARLTVLVQSYDRPTESFVGGLRTFHRPPSL